MNTQEWNELNINDKVIINNMILTVEEICEDEKKLNNWKKRGYVNPTRLIKFVDTNSSFHTWNVNPENFTKCND